MTLIGVSDAIKAAVAIVQKNLVWFVILGLIPQVIVFAITFLFFGGQGEKVYSPGNPYQLINFTQLFSGLIILILISSIVSGFVAIMQLLLVIKTDKGEAVSLPDLLSGALKLFFNYLILGAFVGIIVLVGIFLLIVPGLIFATWYFASFFVLAQEGKTGMEAMRASKELVQGHTMAVMGRFVVGFLIYFAISIVVSIVMVPLNNVYVVSSTISALVSAVLGSVSLAFSYVIYRSLVQLKSGANTPASQPASATPAPQAT